MAPGQRRPDDLRAASAAAPYVDAMRERMAGALGAEAAMLNVKASSPEGLGALGRGEGMSAAAVVLLESA